MPASSMISLGIGDPASIREFVLLGLTPALELTWTIRSGATPIEGVKVWLSTADPFTALNLVGDIQETASDGIATYTLSQDVVYYGWRSYRQFTFSDPFVFRYSSANARWEKQTDGTWSEWTP